MAGGRFAEFNEGRENKQTIN